MRGVRVGEVSHPGLPDHDEWTAPDNVFDTLTPPVPSTTPASVGAVMRKTQEIPVISLADSETDTIDTGPHDEEDPLFEEEGFIGFRPERDADAESKNDGMSVVSGDEPVPSHPEPVLEIPFNDVTFPIREAFRRLDGCDVEQIFARRGCVMKSVLFFSKGPFRSLRIALIEATGNCFSCFPGCYSHEGHEEDL